MKPRFEPDAEADGRVRPASILFDPEAFDASEQEFAASLEVKTGRFVLDTERISAITAESPGLATDSAALGSRREDESSRQQCKDRTPVPPGGFTSCGGTSQAGSHSDAGGATERDSESWRQEVTARLTHYRARRRPREPRYPSLKLKFDTPWPASNLAGVGELPLASAGQAITLHQGPAHGVPAPAEPETPPGLTNPLFTEITGKIIEFPRFTGPPQPLNELAEPVLDCPRILEAIEVEPSLPALGGILIESPEESVPERRPGFEIPLQPAPLARRLAAAAIDGALVTSALAGFVYLFLRIAATVPPLPHAAALVAGLTGFLWVSYQYIMLARCGVTPGLRLAKLRLNRFDGSPVPLRLRRWRVLASILSAASLGLGYAWCFFDEDQLCWHDRITRTYIAPKP